MIYLRNYCVFPSKGEAEVIYEQNYRVEPVTGRVTVEEQDSYFNRDIYHFSSHQQTPNDDSRNYPAVIETENTVYIGWNIFAEYGKIGSLQAKKLIEDAIDYLLGDRRSIKAAVPDRGVLTLTRQEQEKRYIAHLLYAHTTLRGHFTLGSGAQKQVEAIEDIVPLYHVDVQLHVPQKVKKVYLAPQMTEIPFTEENGIVRCEIEKVECHQMVVFDYE